MDRKYVSTMVGLTSLESIVYRLKGNIYVR